MKIRQLAPLVVSLSGCSLLFAPDQYQDGDSGQLHDGGHVDTAVVEASTFDGTTVDAPRVDAESTLDDATTDARRVDADRDGAAEPDGDQWPTCGDRVGDTTLSNALGNSITLSSAFLTWTGLPLEDPEAGLLGSDHNGIEVFATDGGSSPYLQVAVAVVAPDTGAPDLSVVRIGALTSEDLYLEDLDLENGQLSGRVTRLRPPNSNELRAFAMADDGSRVAILGETALDEGTFGWVCEADGSHCDAMTIPPYPPIVAPSRTRSRVSRSFASAATHGSCSWAGVGPPDAPKTAAARRAASASPLSRRSTIGR